MNTARTKVYLDSGCRFTKILGVVARCKVFIINDSPISIRDVADVE